MKKFLFLFFLASFIFLSIEYTASANIAPLKLMPDGGVEPVENPGVKIDSAAISISPLADGSGFKFNCNYILKGLVDNERLTIGIPGDLGYTLEAGYIDGMNVIVNGKPAKYNVYNTTAGLSEKWKDYTLPLHFKWHAFQIPIKKDVNVAVSVTYNTSWKILEQNKKSPYQIVPFLLSTDRLFGDSIGSYKIKYASDDLLSLPDIKVMINSMLEPNIISQSILAPKWTDTEINWEFNNPSEFQDFRLIAISFRKLAMEFSTDPQVDTQTNHLIRWAMLNNNYEKLATIFEDIAKKRIDTKLNSEGLGTAAYLACEFYSRQGKLYNALEMLSLPNKTTLWPSNIKYQYINALILQNQNNYPVLLDELKKLHEHKDYLLVSNYAYNRIGPVTEQVMKEAIDRLKAEEVKEPEKPQIIKELPVENKVLNPYYLIIPMFAAVAIMILMYLKYRHKK